MNAREIADRLGGKPSSNRGYLISCPAAGHVHRNNTPSCHIRDGDKPGVVLATCFTGCPRDDVLRALRDLGLLNSTTSTHYRSVKITPPKPPTPVVNPVAVEIWNASQPSGGTVVETYLRNRGIGIRIPPSLRLGRWKYQGLDYPAMIAAVKADDKLVSVQATLLTWEGHKANVLQPRQNLQGANMFDGAIKLDRLAAKSRVLGLAEGIENALAAMEIFEVSVWATCGSRRMSRIKLPEQVSEVIIFGDNDPAGKQAADAADAEYLDYKVTRRFPESGDWNDRLQFAKRSGVAVHG